MYTAALDGNRLRIICLRSTCDLLMGVVTEKSKDILITEEQKIFIAESL